MTVSTPGAQTAEVRPSRCLGLDIGGANLKAATADGRAVSLPFAVWKQPGRLAEAIGELIRRIPADEVRTRFGLDQVAAATTAELCDCFRTKREGVHALLSALEAALGRAVEQRLIAPAAAIVVWRNDGRFVDLDAARDDPLPVAAANWLALATFAGRFCPEGAAMLVDIGSTTADLVPLLDGRPVPAGRNDTERLAAGELVYTGVVRTPLCAVADRLPWRGRSCRVAAELFATTRDAYLLLGDLPEDPFDCDTADGRPATREFARERLARMIGADGEALTPAEIDAMAAAVRAAQLAQLADAWQQIAARREQDPRTVLLAGAGEFLARRLVDACAQHEPHVVSLARMLGPDISRAACAYALATLAQGRRQ